MGMLLFGASCSGMVFANQTVCVFDLQGKAGEIFKSMEEWALSAKTWNANIKLIPYQSEVAAAQDFKSGKCDGVYMSSMRARVYNKFAGSIDALGAVPSNAIAQVAITYALDKRNSKRLVSKIGNETFEVAGINQLGAAYIFAKINKLDKEDPIELLAGKRFAILGYDIAQIQMVKKVKAVPILSDVTNFVAKFNNNQADFVAAPAYVYKPLEIAKGMGANGAMINFPVVNITMDLVIRPNKFPLNFSDQSRNWFVRSIPKSFAMIKRMEAGIPATSKLNLTENQRKRYQMLIREARIELTRQGVYDRQMMAVLKKARCTVERTNFECSLAGE